MVSTVLDTPDPRGLAEFYRDLLGWSYRPGDEPPAAGEPDPNGQDWLVLAPPGGGVRLAFQKVEQLARSTWPDQTVPQQLHLDFAVPSEDELRAKHDQALQLGATVLFDRTDDPDEPLWVFADPSGHPFCIFVAPDAG
jgi:catechol 2,3-dioxygenase-like lactoylglutathione lyase family enzyme